MKLDSNGPVVLQERGQMCYAGDVDQDYHQEVNKLSRIISIIIASNNEKAALTRCLTDLQDYVSHPAEHEIIVADNASTDGTAELAQQFKAAAFISHPFSGTAEAFNAGARQAKGDLLLFLHSDVLLPPNCLGVLKGELENAPQAAAIGPRLNRSHNLSFQGLKPSAYKTYQELSQFGDMLATGKQTPGNAIWLDNCCLLIKRDAFFQAGCFDETFPSHGAEDIDLGLRLLDKKLSCLVSNRAYAHHDAPPPNRRYEGNTRNFKERWHFQPQYSLNARNDLIPWLQGLPENPSILEIGCACGPTLLKIGELFPHASLYGVELDQGPAKVASHFANVSACNIEELARPDWQSAFDCIICGDVIEHLLRPQAALRNINHYLKPGGRLLLSVPNIMHISIFAHLLHGRFPYTDSGLLDRTHNKFFTMTELKKLLEDTGFQVEDSNSLQLPLTSYEKQLLEKLTPLLEAPASPEELKNYQIHIKAIKTA